MSSPLRVEKNAETPGPEAASPPKKRGARRYVVLGILALMVIIGGIYGYRTFVFYEHHATTDDAQIDGHIDPVLARVSGYVTEVLVKDNQEVHAGDVLVRIDPKDLQAKVDQEQAALGNGQAAVAVAVANVANMRAAQASSRAKAASSRADVTAARSKQEMTAADLERYKALVAKEEISQQQFDAARAAAESARAAAEASRSTAEAARSTADAGAAQIDAAQRQVAAAQASVAQHQATLEPAKLQASDALGTAPASGSASKNAVRRVHA